MFPEANQGYPFLYAVHRASRCPKPLGRVPTNLHRLHGSHGATHAGGSDGQATFFRAPGISFSDANAHQCVMAEEAGFESVAGRGQAARSQIFRAPKDESGGIRLPIAWRGARRTSHLGTFLLRHLCFEIGRRGGARSTVLMTFVSSVHSPKIMLGMLVKDLCGDPIATRRRLP